MTDFDRPTSESGSTPGSGSADSDTTASPVPTTTADRPRPASTAPRTDRARTVAAAALIALVVGVTAVATLVLTGASPTSVVLGYVPADSVAYGELRLDLPGDQRQKVAQFLAKFPGFADQAALETKLDEVLDRLVSEGSSGKQSYTRDVKPWFDGQMGFAVGPIPATAATDPAASPKDVRGLLLLSVKDEALARNWFTTTLEQTGVTGTTETYQGVQLTLFSSDEASGTQAAFTVAGGKVAIVGDVASVKAAVDTKGSSALARGSAVTAAQAALSGDDLGFVFLDMKAVMEATTRLSESMSSGSPVGNAFLSLVPDWAAMRVRVDGDALRLDGVSQHKAGTPGPDENRPNRVAAFAPPTTVALLSGNDYGATLLEWIELYRSEPALADVFVQLDQAAGMLGGLDALLSWVGDAGIIVATAGDSVEGGFVTVPANAAGGRQLLTTLRSFVQLGGAQAGITISDETYNGQTITVVDLGDLRDLVGLAGAMGGPVPAAPNDLPSGRVQLAYVATDEVIAIGSSADFIKHVLDAGAGASLADDARFQGLVGRVDTQHSGVTFIDITAIRTMAEGMMSTATEAERAEYEESVKPFLVPFDALISSGTVGGQLDQTRTVITVE